MAKCWIVAALFLLVLCADAQKFGTNVQEGHPKLTTHRCTSKGCEAEKKAVVIDANWRWVHNVDGYTNCYDKGIWDTNLCPDVATCDANCAIEGIDEKAYATNYGVSSNDTELRLQFVVPTGNVGSRTYLIDDDDMYKSFNLKNQEFAFDVDVSSLGCGLNGALYFVQMDRDGGKSEYPGNTAGAKYGTGYCDAQCPQDVKFINGEANILDWHGDPGVPGSGFGKYGTCCVEMDLWEANSRASAFTGHACNTTRQTRCEGVGCGDASTGDRFNGMCDADGCDFQAYRLGAKDFYGAGDTFKIDTRQPFTVVTQFITADGTADGPLSEIRRHYVQKGVKIDTPSLPVGGDQFDSLGEEYCTAEKKAFNSSSTFLKRGGMKSIDEAMTKGMVLVLSIWDDYDSHMLWLDSTDPPHSTSPGAARGPCPTDSGDPKVLRPGSKAYVSYSNIRYGDIGTTDRNFPPSPPMPPPSPPSPPPPLGEYSVFAASNCYDGHGGRPLDGEGAGPFTVKECEYRCDADTQCDCFTYQPSARHCWKRAACVPANFEKGNTQYDTYVKGIPSEDEHHPNAEVAAAAVHASAAAFKALRG